MDCEAVFDLLSAQLDGELSPEGSAQLERHLAHCAPCRALAEDLSTLSAAIPAAVEVTPPPELMERVLADLPPRKSSKPVIFLAWKRWAASAAAIAVIALSAFHLPGLFSTPSADSAPTQPDTVLEDAPTADAPEDTSAVTGAGLSVASVEDNSTPAVPQSARAENTSTPAAEGRAARFAASAPTDPPSAQSHAFFSGRAVVEEDAVAEETESAEEQPSGETLETSPLESAKTAQEQELCVNVEDFESITQISEQYFAILTLSEAYIPQGLTGYPQENGDIWYYLPVTQFQSLLRSLTAQNLPFELTDSGENVSHSQPEALVIVQAND